MKSLKRTLSRFVPVDVVVDHTLNLTVPFVACQLEIPIENGVLPRNPVSGVI